jgi:protein-S-isoprenylcysteine O-methyltransferase Ste14
MIDYIILFLGWVIYFFIHSMLASDHVKDQFIAVGRISAKRYRMVYSVISVVGLFGILALQMLLQSFSLYPSSKTSMFIGLVIATYGLLVLKKSFRFISVSSFLGLKEEAAARMIKEGLHKKVRHPIYTGTILIVIGAVVFTPTDLMLVSALSILAYLPVGIMLEEDKLIKEYGNEYLVYRKTTPAIFPKIKSLF